MILFMGSKQLDSLKQKIGSLDFKLSNSFENVRSDVNNLYAWVDYLNAVVLGQGETINSQAGTIAGIQHTLENVPKDRDEIRRIIDEYYSLQPFAQKLNEVMARIDALESSGPGSQQIASLKAKVNKIIYEHPLMLDAVEELKVRVNALGKKSLRQVSAQPKAEKRQYTRSRLQEKIIKSVARSSKEYVKGMILSLIQKYRDISALKLREIIVEEQGIASKSSFYRMLEELEREGIIDMIRAGKEKHYFALEQAARVV